ncbi:GAF and ANTAR domain-containing protein [Arthrobacter sp. ISL-30]|uniref:GAF and ANTAR domain-containing protein n=1 Tax=Arthrobacter sp. ISL-30 TaxID=2819109 RepID=UPI001BEB56A0|nr:GAF and ANTAR domain-containing protein [Arthrobacter sp. ISL-30]MBT2512547.1 GAF and ANTAR domain-containing protein [Arthrobacter sp. ISL-30]
MAESMAPNLRHELTSAIPAFGLDGTEVDAFFKAAMDELMQDIVGESTGLSWAISVLWGDNVSTWTASGHETAEVDGLQHSFEDGPALAAIRQHEFVQVADTRLERRWPGYASAIVGHGVSSLLAVPLDPAGPINAAITLYAPQPHAFTSDDILKAQDYARQIVRALRLAIQLSRKREAKTGLVLARRSRALLGLALRTLMREYGLSHADALQYLRNTARSSSLGLQQAAREFVSAGSMRAVPGNRESPSTGKSA